MYAPGKNRLFYQATGFKTGLNVTIKFWEKKSGWKQPCAAKEIGEGLYYIDYEFEFDGPYLGIVFEDGVPKTSQIFRIMKLERTNAIEYSLIN